MKHHSIIPLLVLAFAFSIAGCKPEIEGELGDPRRQACRFLGYMGTCILYPAGLEQPSQGNARPEQRLHPRGHRPYAHDL